MAVCCATEVAVMIFYLFKKCTMRGLKQRGDNGQEDDDEFKFGTRDKLFVT